MNNEKNKKPSGIPERLLSEAERIELAKRNFEKTGSRKAFQPESDQRKAFVVDKRKRKPQ